MSNGFETVLYEKQGAVAQIVLNRPDALNALNTQMRDDLWELLSAIELDPDIRSVIISGAGKRAFCAGADLHEFGQAPSQDIARYVRQIRDLWSKFSLFAKPSIAVLSGYVIGSGLEIAMLCDIRIASYGATFFLPETSLGLIPAASGTQTLPWIIGHSNALNMILTGRKLDVYEAQDAGLIHRLVPPSQLFSSGLIIGKQLADLKPEVVTGIKRAIADSRDGNLEYGLSVENRIALEIAVRNKT